ncbi:hypothetical protein BDZ89DRAFT_978266 [Hymenopellis radicata]|nr:hypothetical protein BDZ89DRAFT_978266 [Hymenopellis radicata]
MSGLVGTNRIPSHEQILEINALLAAQFADLARLELEITRVSTLLQHLVSQRDDTRTCINSHLAILTPIRRLPVEILQEIFGHCLPAKQSCAASQAPLVLTRVCVLWRQVAIGTPRLWDTLVMRLPSRPSFIGDDTVVSTRSRLRLMALWLERSKAVPFTLLLSVPHTIASVVEEFLPLFHAHLHRFRDLRLWLPICWLKHVLPLITIGTTWPVLEQLEVSFSPVHGPSSGMPVIQLDEERMPRLRHLFLRCGGHGSPASAELSSPSRTLRSLDLDFAIAPSECRRILSECPNLLTCRLRAVDGFSSHPDPGATVLYCLEDFNVQTSQPISLLLDSLCLPALKSLHISETITFDSARDVWSQHTFDNFIENSGCKLESLLLHNVLRSEDELIRCLSTSKSLKHFGALDLRELTLCTDRALEMMTARPGEPCLAPNLQSLRLGSTLISEDGAFGAMVNSRWSGAPGVARLLSVTPTWTRGKHEEDIRQLRMLRDRGLDVANLL